MNLFPAPRAHPRTRPYKDQSQPTGRSRRIGRTAAVLSIAVITVSAATSPAIADPVRSAGGSHSGYLVAADPAAREVYFYRTSDLRRTGQLDGIGFGSHVGSLALPDGRLLMIDDANAKVVAVRVDRRGKPEIVATAAIPSAKTWERAAWAATDKNSRYLALSSDFADSGTQTVTVVDLRTYAVHQSTVTLTANAAGTFNELQVYLAGSPLQLVATTGGAFQSFPLADVLAGRKLVAVSSSPLRANNHGPVVARDGSAVFSTTENGLDGASIPGRILTSPRTVDYSAVRNVVQNYRPRLGSDLRTVWGAVSEDTGLSAAAWADTRNDISRIDLKTFRSVLTRLPDGLPSRIAVSDKLGVVSVISPDGDTASLIDTATGSATFGRTVGLVALPSLTGGPVAGQPTTGTQSHFVAITPDGEQAFVSNGGDSTITVIDTARRAVGRTISVPSSLTGGGYLTVIEEGAEQPDLIAR